MKCEVWSVEHKGQSTALKSLPASQLSEAGQDSLPLTTVSPDNHLRATTVSPDNHLRAQEKEKQLKKMGGKEAAFAVAQLAKLTEAAEERARVEKEGRQLQSKASALKRYEEMKASRERG